MERGAPPGRDMALSLLAVTVPQHDELACSRRWHRHGEVSVAPLAATAKPPMERPMDRSIGGFAGIRPLTPEVSISLFRRLFRRERVVHEHNVYQMCDTLRACSRKGTMGPCEVTVW